jgi:hypothetical protein
MKIQPLLSLNFSRRLKKLNTNEQQAFLEWHLNIARLVQVIPRFWHWCCLKNVAISDSK